MSTCTNLHAAVDTLVQAHRDELHRLVQAAESKLARDMHWETTANRQRDEIARLTLESEGRRKALEQVGEERREQWIRAERAEAEVARLRQDLADATEAIRPYAATLTAIRMELGTIEDADLVEEAGRLRALARAACCWRLAETSWDERENAKAPALLDLFRADIDALDALEQGNG